MEEKVLVLIEALAHTSRDPNLYANDKRIKHWGKNPELIQKFTFWKYHFSQNSLFQDLIFH